MRLGYPPSTVGVRRRADQSPDFVLQPGILSGWHSANYFGEIWRIYGRKVLLVAAPWVQPDQFLQGLHTNNRMNLKSVLLKRIPDPIDPRFVLSPGSPACFSISVRNSKYFCLKKMIQLFDYLFRTC